MRKKSNWEKFYKWCDNLEISKNVSSKKHQGLQLKGVYIFTLEDINTGERQIIRIPNLVPTVGRAAIADHLTSGSPSPSTLLINKAALGTGTTAPANGDTTLETETYRNNTASKTNADNIAYVTAFFSATEVDGTFKEVGLFINGEAGADTGTLFSRAAIDITKSNTQTLTIDYVLTIS
jgi:hypothetical protein